MLRTAAALCLLLGVSVQAAAQNGESNEISCLNNNRTLQECRKEFLDRKRAEISLRTQDLVETAKKLLADQNGPVGGTPWSPTATERIRGSIPQLRY